MPEINHHFFSRAGGVSSGLYASLNVGIGSGDNPEDVMENRRRVAQHFGLQDDALATVKQVHSATAVTLDAVPALAVRPDADGMVTATPNIILGILTADCVPVLFQDARAGVIGAAHAGWKGAYSGILENTIRAMENLGANRAEIRALIGPCIAQKSYEVGAEFRTRLLEEHGENEALFIPSVRSEHFLFDLQAYVIQKLKAAGILHIVPNTHDTCADAQNYFSYRRSCLQGEPDYGRQISCIVMKG